ncbi:hypothetical protein [Nocardia canadensis]|uniref:hypothetical protein n=1 Tax=Nocardia canadensis TaxID=3065238 RepID=UPI00292F98D8|nr:hypothetical protein [Nocardia canadensis]
MTYPNPHHDSAPQHADRHDDEFPDHARTTRSHAGEGLEDGYNFPGIILCALGVIALGLCLTATGYGFTGWATVAGVAAVLLAGAGVVWLLLEHRRIKAKEGLKLTDQRGH